MPGIMPAASLIAMVWEWFISLDHEVTFIWPMANTAYVKWLYIFAKYFALVVQTGVASVQLFYFTIHSMSTENCRIYRALEMTAVTFLMLCFDVVLLLRIYALYGRHAWSCVFATLAVLIELLTTIASMIAAIPTMTYDSACIMVGIPKSIIVFVAGTFASQTVLLWLAYRKRDRVVRPRASIACVTIRDGLLVFVCIAGKQNNSHIYISH
ncbi:hypothetical protein J3R82DRAFT_2741 [Butyriboletus roseoflavus]|nr:hypothetical protein J3R82DRAFT_2741 [Butyriboletus roseoflavus]